MTKGIVPFSQLKTQPRLDLSESLPLRMPLTMFIEPTNICNFRCVQCPVSFPDFRQIVPQGTMKLGLFEKIVSDIATMGVLASLRLHMLGEPLLNRDISEMIEIANEAGIARRIELTTNASLLSENMSERLVRSGLDYLRVSIYSVHDERQSEITGSKITTGKILDNVRKFRAIRNNLQSQKPFLYVKMLDTGGPENEEFRLLYENIADEVAIETPMNWNGFENRDLLGKLKPGEKVLSTVSSSREICPFPFYSLVVNCDGEVSICCVDWNRNTKVGDLKEESLAEIWTGARLRDLRQMFIDRRRHENASCRNCEFFRTLPDNLDNVSPERFREIMTAMGGEAVAG